MNWSEKFLSDGLAVSKTQSEHMAQILDSRDLSPESTLCMLWIAQKTGASFDPSSVTDEQIDDACNELNAIRLAEAAVGRA